MSRGRLALLQLCDSLFPLGAFAHSDGLEAAVAAGQVESPADLEPWMHTLLAVTLRQYEAPAVRDAFTAFAVGDLTAVATLDDDVHALRPSKSGRAANRAMGTRLLRTWQHIRPASTVARLGTVRAHVSLPIAFGVICADSGTSRLEAVESFMYTRLASTVSAAMRLIAVGQHDAHRLLASHLDHVPAAAAAVEASSAPPQAFTPLMDIAAMSHPYVFSRLFRS
jgi:urease accessory protein